MSDRACIHCGSENDSTRVFCSNCGTRLPERAPEPGGEAPATPGRCAPPLPQPVRGNPVKPLPKPAERGITGVLVRELILTAFLAAILAGMIQMAREPDQIPPRSGASDTGARETLATLRELGSSTRPIRWTINQNAANEFLATTIQMEQSNSLLQVKFGRAFVRLDTGRLTCGIEQQFLGRSLYLLLDVVPEASPQGLDAKVVGGAIGRLPVPPALLPVFMRLFQPMITGLAQPLDLIRQAKSVAVTPTDVTLQWAGTASR